MKVLIACEFSGTVRDAFIAKGHDAWSCDIMPTEKPGPHIEDDVLLHIDTGEWDMMIAFPPCTHLAVSGAKHFEQKRKDGRQHDAILFFLMLADAPINKICIENPIGIMSGIYKKPDQIIQPWQFGDTYQKTTCLWLKNLPKLFHAKQKDLFNDKITHVDKGEFIVTAGGNKLPKWYSDAKVSSKELTQKVRSKTFPGIANAMAEQWN